MIARLQLELAYNDVTVQHVNHNSTIKLLSVPRLN